jgi:hypothetical protein
LAAIPADWRVAPAGAALFRVYRRGGPHPGTWNGFRFYGPLNGRFDPHELPRRVQERGILYAATHPAAALAEFFQARRTINARRDEPWLVGFRLTADIRLPDLTGLWPTRAGASRAINSGLRATARRWSGAIHETYPDAGGLWYGSFMYAHAPCVALYERAAGALPTRPSFHRALADDTLRAFLETCAAVLGYRLVL